jgi:DNA excision repair protein ERCC-3
LSELSGGQDMAYIKQNRSKNKELKKDKKASNPFFRKLQRDNQKRRLG